MGDRRKMAFDDVARQRQEIEKSLTTERQRFLFRQAADSRLEQEMTRADQHQATQTDIYAKGQAAARASGELMDSFNAFGTPDFDVHKANMLRAVDQTTALHFGAGAAPEVFKAGRLNATSKLTADIIDDMLTTDRTDQAREYLKQAVAAGEVDPQTQGQLQGKVDRQGNTDSGTSLAHSVIATIDGQTMRDMEASSAEMVGKTKWTTPVDATSIDPQVQLGKYLSELTRQYDGKQISDEVYKAARAEAIFQANQRTHQDDSEVRRLKQRAEEWAMKQTGPAENVPADIYDAMQKRGVLGALVDIQQKANRSHSAAISQSAEVMKDELKALSQDVEDMQAGQSALQRGMKTGKTEQEALAAIKDEKIRADAARSKNDLKAAMAQQQRMRQKIASYRSALEQMTTTRANMPQDVAPPEDPRDKLLRELLMTPAPQWPAGTGRGK
jgi:hypothetical protein